MVTLHSIAIDPRDEIIFVGGFTNGSLYSDNEEGKDDGGLVLTSLLAKPHVGSVAIVIKLSSDGQLLKAVQFGSTAADRANSIILSNGGVFIAGSTSGCLLGDHRGGEDAWIAKVRGFTSHLLFALQLSHAVLDELGDPFVGSPAW